MRETDCHKSASASIFTMQPSTVPSPPLDFAHECQSRTASHKLLSCEVRSFIILSGRKANCSCTSCRLPVECRSCYLLCRTHDPQQVGDAHAVRWMQADFVNPCLCFCARLLPFVQCLHVCEAHQLACTNAVGSKLAEHPAHMRRISVQLAMQLWGPELTLHASLESTS